MKKKEKIESPEKSRDKKIVRAIIISAILAAAVGVGVFFSIKVNKATVYSFKGDYTAGTAVKQEMLVPVEVDKTIVVNGQKSDINSKFITESQLQEVLASADKLRMDVGAGAFLTENALVEKGGNEIENALTSNYIAVTVEVDSVTGVTNDLRAGSYANVYLRVAGKSNTLQNIKILSVNKDKNKAIQSATLECDYAQAEVIAQAQAEGSIQLGLVGSAYQQVEQ